MSSFSYQTVVAQAIEKWIKDTSILHSEFLNYSKQHDDLLKIAYHSQDAPSIGTTPNVGCLFFNTPPSDRDVNMTYNRQKGTDPMCLDIILCKKSVRCKLDECVHEGKNKLNESSLMQHSGAVPSIDQTTRAR